MRKKNVTPGLVGCLFHIQQLWMRQWACWENGVVIRGRSPCLIRYEVFLRLPPDASSSSSSSCSVSNFHWSSLFILLLSLDRGKLMGPEMILLIWGGDYSVWDVSGVSREGTFFFLLFRSHIWLFTLDELNSNPIKFECPWGWEGVVCI